MHLCNTKYNSYRLVLVNAQHNVDLYIKLRLLIKKDNFRSNWRLQKKTILIVEPGVLSDRSENR